MALYRRGGVWHYDFAIDGRRYRGSTKERSQSKARAIESALISDASQSRLSARRRSETLAEFSARFLGRVKSSRLAFNTKRYYETGWKLLQTTPVIQMRIAQITTDDGELLKFDHSSANANCALRTLRRMLGKAAEWKVISAPPRIKLLKEEGRSAIFDTATASKLLSVAKQPLKDVATIVLDCGMRPSEVFAMRWEEVDWEREMIFIPRGKTKRSRRFLPISKRVKHALLARMGTKADDWVFPSDSCCGHITTVAKAFQTARKEAGLPEDLVLYSGRHTFGTKLLESTGNLSLVMRAMGHSSVQTTMIYQHPDLEIIRAVMDGDKEEGRPRHNSRHSDAA